MAESVWILPFGKYQGYGIEDAPDKYLEWLLEQDWFCEKFADKVALIEKELSYRDEFSSHIGWEDEE